MILGIIWIVRQLLRPAIFVSILGLMLCDAAWAVGPEVDLDCGTGPFEDEWITARDDRFYTSDEFESLFRAKRVVAVPEVTRDDAIERLQIVPILPLDEDALAQLFPGDRIDGNQLVNAVVAAAEAEAKRLEDMLEPRASEGPPDDEWVTSIRNLAASWRAMAERERTLLNNVKPYLIRAVSANPAAVFELAMFGDELMILSAALGCPRLRKTPAVVFLDHEPRRLHVFTSNAL